MTLVTLPNGAGLTGANTWARVYDNDNAMLTVVNGDIRNDNISSSAAIASTKLASVNFSSYRTILKGSGTLGSATAKMPTQGVATTISGIPPASAYIAPSDYAVSGFATYFRLQVLVFTNATAPATTFTATLVPLTVAGGTDAITWNVGTAVESSTATITTPTASTATVGTSSDFAISDTGVYAIALAVTDTQATNAALAFASALQVRNV